MLVREVSGLPQATPGKIECVAWATSGNTAYFVFQNATDAEIILTQSTAKALDAAGATIAESDPAEYCPYRFAAGSYGLGYASFPTDVSGAASISPSFETKPLSSSTGKLANLTVTDLQVESEIRVTVTLENPTDTTFDFAAIHVLFFDDQMKLVGGCHDVALKVAAKASTTVNSVVVWGAPTNRFLAAALGAMGR